MLYHNQFYGGVSMKRHVSKKILFMFTFIFIFSTISIFSLPSKKAFADVEGGKWNTTIKYFIKSDDKSLSQSDFDSYNEMFDGTAEIWNVELINLNSNVRIKRANSASDANLMVTFRTAGGASGITWVFPSKTSKTYTSARMYLSPGKLSDLDQKSQNSVMLHELGHVLGLAHAPEGTDSVMIEEPTYGDAKHWPTSYDLNDLRRLYKR